MIFSILYFILFFGIFLSLLVLQKINRRPTPLINSGQPLISILIAVRNEENNIIRCLQHIEKLNYPKEKIEILIGDDASTDNTFSILQKYIQNKLNITCIPITEKLGQARGKANVLAHLTKLATSNFFFITDADIAVPPNWVQHMLAGVKENTGIVTGITTISGHKLFHRLQAIDWFNALSLIQIVADFKLPVGTMGNNMLITRQAYEATGGYENMPFSVTEDVQLFKAVMQQNFGFKNIFDAGVLALSMPVVLAIFLGKLYLQTVFIYRSLQRVHLSFPIWQLLLFEFYAIFVSVSTILFFLLPVKLTWKDRKY